MCTETPGQVMSIDVDSAVALVNAAGRLRRASLGVMRLEGREVHVGDWVLTHTGLIVARIDAADALARIAELRAMQEEVQT